MALIELKNIERVYDGEGYQTRALRGVSFDVEKGEFVAIMGPSGSGKSTLLHILGFLDKQTKGTYKFNNKTFEKYSETDIARLRNKELGFVFQSFNLLPRTSLIDNVMLPLHYSDVKAGKWRDKALSVIKAVGLEHRVNHEPSQLSGGERQRAAIARALVNDPKVIFADEPTGNLDSESGGAVMDILQSLNIKHGHTIILITHETYTAEHASRIINLLDGKLLNDKKVSRRKSSKDKYKK